jgi:D-alanyl-lipoteichoic acid acyltransferase DltB (MBOAT superfamily)
MLFNSFEFLFLFLPVTLLLFYLVPEWVAGFFPGRRPAETAWRVRINIITLASLFFYGWWNPIYLLLLASLVVFNFLVGRWLLSDRPARKAALVFGITVDLAALGFFKYANFIVDNIDMVGVADWHLGHIVLPLAISFFTFQKIAYLVDAYRREVDRGDFGEFCLFVAFFPQLIAGPIVHYKEVLPQFRRWRQKLADVAEVEAGLTLLAIGLFKKVVLADTLALFATPVFEAAEQGHLISTAAAWGGALAYTFQLYFDFSGYSDMAIGLGLLFGIRLPLNFNSPYKATDIADFWRRWHMTLSRFLRDYLYIPLGGNRKGPLRTQVNLMLTMLLGGLWHGAGWTFIVWGGLHGLFLIAHRLWGPLRRRLGMGEPSSPIPGMLVTFFFVVIAWVFFRAHTFTGAWHLLGAMFQPSLDGLQIGNFWLLLLAAAWGICVLAPNSQTIAERPSWHPVLVRYTVAVFTLLVLGHQSLNSAFEAEFLYFNF